jgi:hypothetical protein
MMALAMCAALGGSGLSAEDDGPTTVPDPVGLGERLALIDYLHDHAQQVEPGADLAALRHQYRALLAAAAGAPDKQARDAAALELWRTYGESATADETLAQIKARLDQLAAKASTDHQQELAHEADDSRAAEAAPQHPNPTAPARPAAAGDAPADQPAPVLDMPPPTGKPGADGDWTSDYRAACASATDMGRPLLVDYTGSDWCVWCRKLELEVFATPAFRGWAARHVVLMRVDFPQKTKLPEAVQAQNQALREANKVTGFPTVLVFSGSGSPLGKLGYQPGGPEPWIAAVARLAHM